MGSTSWEPFDATRRKRTIKSWARDLTYLDVVQLCDESGALSYARLTPVGVQGIAASNDGEALWNLVLACWDCNRGPGGKFDAVPALA